MSDEQKKALLSKALICGAVALALLAEVVSPETIKQIGGRRK